MNDPYNYEDYIIRMIRDRQPEEYEEKYYDIYLPKINKLYKQDTDVEFTVSTSPFLRDAIWALCLRGVLRPVPSTVGIGIIPKDGPGQGFSITNWGWEWINEHNPDNYVPFEPLKLSGLFKSHGELFGEAYLQRSLEAVKCLFSHSHFACCAMCGAASEAIVFRIGEAAFGESDIGSLTRKREGFREIIKRIKKDKWSSPPSRYYLRKWRETWGLANIPWICSPYH